MHPEDTSGFRLVGHSDLIGHGDGMQVMPHGDALYVGHFGPSGKGTSILDISDPTTPHVIRQWEAPPGSHTHKVQVADELLLVNHELFRSDGPAPVGMAIYDLDDPKNPTRSASSTPVDAVSTVSSMKAATSPTSRRHPMATEAGSG